MDLVENQPFHLGLEKCCLALLTYLGASLAPDEIRKHSYNFETYLLELGVDITDVSMNDWGNIDVSSDQEKNEAAVEELVSKIVNANKFPHFDSRKSSQLLMI